MKKKIMTALCIMTLGLGMTVSVSAANSPQQKPIEQTTKAPETGEANTVAASLAAVAALGGVVVISKKKLAD